MPLWDSWPFDSLVSNLALCKGPPTGINKGPGLARGPWGVYGVIYALGPGPFLTFFPPALVLAQLPGVVVKAACPSPRESEFSQTPVVA